MASVQLTAHAVSRLLAGEHVDRPIMQVLAVKSLSLVSASGLQRYRLKLSDGRAETVRAMLSTQMNHVVEDPRAPLQHAIVCLEQYSVHENDGKKIVAVDQIAFLCFAPPPTAPVRIRTKQGAQVRTRPRPTPIVVRTVFANSELLQSVVAHGSTLEGAASLMLAAANLLDADGRAHALLGVCRAIPKIALERRPEWCGNRETMTLACTKQATLLEKAAVFLRDDETVVAAALRACEPEGEVLQWASERLRGDEALVTIAVTQDGDNLEHASEAMRANRSVVLCAVAEWGLALRHASDELRDDRDVVLQACGPNEPSFQTYDGEGPLTYASERLRGDREIALVAMNEHGASLEILSAELRNDEAIVHAAGETDPFAALQYGNERFRDDDDFVIKMATSCGDSDLAEYISERLLDDGEFMRRMIVELRDGYVLMHGSERLRSQKQLALLALSHDASFILQNLSPALQDDACVVLGAVSKNPGCLEFASERLRAERFVCLEAINSPGTPEYSSIHHKAPLQFMSPTLRNDHEIVLKSVKKNGFSIQHASAELKELNTICVAAVKQNGLALQKCLPSKRDAPAIVHEALRQNPQALKHASERLRGDAETVSLAIRRAGKTWKTKVLPHMTPAMRGLAGLLPANCPELLTGAAEANGSDVAVVAV